MADIDQILAGGANASTRADFSGLAGIPDAYFSGAKQSDELAARRAFRGGVPTDENGQPDFGAMAKTFFQKGDYQQGIAAANLDLQRQQLKFGQQQSGQISNYEQPGSQPQPQPQPQAPLVSPPSVNRSASTPVAAPLAKGGTAPPNSPQGDQPGSIVGLVSAAGIPDQVAGPVIGSLAKGAGIDPNAPIPPEMLPRVQAAIQAFKARNGGGQPPAAPAAPGASPPTPPGAIVPVSPGAAPTQPIPGSAAPPVPPQMAQAGPQPGPVTNAVTGTSAPPVPSRVDQGIAFYSGIMSNPMSPKTNVELAKTRLEALQKSNETTNEQKNYIQAKLEGFPGTMQDYQAKTEADKTYAAENAKSYVKKYDTIQTAGDRARLDIPQLETARKLTEDPSFYSGVGEKYNLLVKRALVALGGDPNTAAPQEAFRKIVSNSILDQIKSMAGTGPIRVAEMKIMQDAAANPDNTPQANRLLLELSTRLQKRSAAIADMAQNYNGGRLDSGFDRMVANYDRKNPIISDQEIPNFRAIIDSGASKPASGQPQFSNPSDVHAAIAAGKLKSGDAFTDGKGKTRYVP